MKINIVFLILVSMQLAACAQQGGSSSSTPPEAVQKAYTDLAIEYLQSDDVENAKLSLKRSLDKGDAYAPTHNALGLVFKAENDMELAEIHFQRAIQLDPMNALYFNNFGAFLYAAERYPEACMQFARATEDPFYPARAHAFENMGRCYMQLKRFDVAEHALRRSLDLQQDRPQALLYLAEVLLKRDKVSEAGFVYDRYRARVEEPNIEQSPKSLWLGIQIAEADNNPVRAATYALLLKNMYPDSEEYKLYQGIRK